VQSLKCVIRPNRSCNLHSAVRAIQMFNVYHKNHTREMILKSIATNINGQLVLAAKIIFPSFINAESLKFLSPTCGHRKEIQSNRRQAVYLVRLRATCPRAKRNEHEIDPFPLRFNKCEKFLFTWCPWTAQNSFLIFPLRCGGINISIIFHYKS